MNMVWIWGDFSEKEVTEAMLSCYSMSLWVSCRVDKHITHSKILKSIVKKQLKVTCFKLQLIQKIMHTKNCWLWTMICLLFRRWQQKLKEISIGWEP